MKKILKKQFFNLIEVTMAIAVVGIGIAGVMAMLPPAIEANRSADYNNYTGDVVSTLATYIEKELQKKWDAFDGKIQEDTKPAAADSNLQHSPDSSWTEIPGLNGIYVKNIGGKYYFAIKSVDDAIKANILVWQKKIGDTELKCPTESAVSGINGIRMYFELSYPTTALYENRQKKQYVYEFYKR